MLTTKEIRHARPEGTPHLNVGEDPPRRRVDCRTNAAIRAAERGEARIERLRDRARCGFGDQRQLDVRRRLQLGLVRNEKVISLSGRLPRGTESEHRPCGEPWSRPRPRLCETSIRLLMRGDVRRWGGREDGRGQKGCYAHMTSVCRRRPYRSSRRRNSGPAASAITTFPIAWARSKGSPRACTATNVRQVCWS